MPKAENYHFTLEDIVRIAEAFPLMVAVCQKVDALDHDTFHVLGDYNRSLLYDARLASYKALKKLGGG